jgi:hypothetical protein
VVSITRANSLFLFWRFNKLEGNIFEPFLNRDVIVETDAIQVKGILVYYKVSEREGHEPFILVLRSEGRTVVLRNWVSIKKLRNEWEK